MTKNLKGRLVTRGNSTPETARQYLADRSQLVPSGCIEWTKSTLGRGYGQAWYQGRAIGAHVLAYLVTKGDVPAGHHVRHSCDNPPCINPEHLSLGLRAANMRDMVERRRHSNQRKTHCKNGHEFTEQNTLIRARGWRACRACSAAATARYLARKNAHA